MLCLIRHEIKSQEKTDNKINFLQFIAEEKANTGHCGLKSSIDTFLFPYVCFNLSLIVIGAEFITYMEAFKPYLVESLRNRAEYQVMPPKMASLVRVK